MRLLLTILITAFFFIADSNFPSAMEISVPSIALETTINDSISASYHQIDSIALPKYNQQKNDDSTQKIISRKNVGQMHLTGSMPLPRILGDTSNTLFSETFPYYDKAMKSPANNLNRFFYLHFENDIFAETDFYFTNGAEIGFVNPWFERLFLPGKLPSAGKKSFNHYGVSLRQNIYTPIDPESSTINYNDRPFAGILILDFFKISISQTKKLRLSTSVQIGAIGPASMASSFQHYLHELEPKGWDFQISNDFLLNFNTHLEHVLLSNSHSELSVFGTIKLGSYQTNLSSGFSFRTGLLPSSFHPIAPSRSYSTNNYEPRQGLPVWFFADVRGKRVVHDASLNGGLFNKNSPYTISYANTNKYTLEVSTGISAAYRNSIIAIKLVYLSPEFSKGTDHRWGAISIMHNF
jgi:lipid A 3-O-deacylase